MIAFNDIVQNVIGNLDMDGSLADNQVRFNAEWNLNEAFRRVSTDFPMDVLFGSRSYMTRPLPVTGEVVVSKNDVLRLIEVYINYELEPDIQPSGRQAMDVNRGTSRYLGTSYYQPSYDLVDDNVNLKFTVRPKPLMPIAEGFIMEFIENVYVKATESFPLEDKMRGAMANLATALCASVDDYSPTLVAEYTQLYQMELGIALGKEMKNDNS